MRCSELEKALKQMDKRYVKAFVWAFALINLAFLFHSINFMFGDHDWNYVRGATYWNEGAFEGRPLHFVLQSLFFGGQILPFLNNFLAFAAMALSGILLAKYWKLPLSVADYALFAAFPAVLPYTLVWLYYAKDTLINLSLPLLSIAALLCAAVAVEQKKPWLHLPAVLLMFFAIASYAAVINLFGVCLIGAFIAAYAGGASFRTAVRAPLFAMLDVCVALVLYKCVLAFSDITSDYNTRIITLAYLPEKLMETLKAMLSQFVVPLPFMEYKYKLLLLAFCLFGFGAAVWRAGLKKLPLLLLAAGGLLLASKAAFFIADERGQILAEMENFAYVPRLDFYGLAYIYALAAALVLRFSAGRWRKAGLVFVVVLVFMSCVRDMYAQKVWKLGFDAEMKAHERVVARIESRPEFNIRRRYRLLQIGSFSLRQNYYRRGAGEETSLDLLETSFTPEFMSRIVYNFYYPEDVFYANAVVEELSPRGKEFIATTAKPWPAQESVYIDGDIVVVVLTGEGLDKARRKIGR